MPRLTDPLALPQASRCRTPLCNLALIAAAAGDDIGAFLRAVQPPIVEVVRDAKQLNQPRLGCSASVAKCLPFVT